MKKILEGSGEVDVEPPAKMMKLEPGVCTRGQYLSYLPPYMVMCYLSLCRHTAPGRSGESPEGDRATESGPRDCS